jgi:signal recognition particle subunit SRP9
MVYLVSFDDFLLACARLYNESNGRCRFVVKYRNGGDAAHVVLKLTDDKLCLKFKSAQQTAIQQIAQVNLLLLNAMASGQPIASDASPVVVAASSNTTTSQ